MGKRERDNSVLSLIEFIEYLREHPQEHKVSALAEHFGVKRNQIYRWVNYAYDRYGIPIDQHPHPLVKRGNVKIGEGSNEIKRVFLDRYEVEALIAASARVDALTPFAKEALYKLEEAARIPEHYIENPIIYTPLVDDYPEELFERIANAIRNYRVALISYRNAKGDEKTYAFNSYAIIVHDQHLHLVGENHNSIDAGFRNPTTLRLDQILEFTLQQEKFKKPAFDAQSYARKEFGPFKSNDESVLIRVEFSQEKAGYIKRTKRHSSQEIIDGNNGKVIWKIEAPLTESLVHWIVSYGPHAKVLEPEELREQVIQWARGSLDANS